MNFQFSPEQLQIQDAIEKLCKPFDADYWLKKDEVGDFPFDFHQALADAGWLGIAMPTEYGGSGLGITEAALMMRTISESGAGLSGASAVHMNIFGLHPVVVFGTDEQKKRWLPPLIAGKDRACFGVTEPNAGLNTLKLSTKAVKQGDHYVVCGQKIWISTAQVANKILLLARTTPVEEAKGTEGLSLFYTDLDRSCIDVREIEKMGRKCVDSNEVFIDQLKIPAHDLIGEEGKGFSYIMQHFALERLIMAVNAHARSEYALEYTIDYMSQREAFGTKITLHNS
jgi:acyl-CoA dehydrogenase